MSPAATFEGMQSWRRGWMRKWLLRSVDCEDRIGRLARLPPSKSPARLVQGNEAALAPELRLRDELPTFLPPLAVFAFARVTVRPFFAGQGFRSAALPIADVLEAVLVVVIGAFAIQGSQPRLASQPYLRVGNEAALAPELRLRDELPTFLPPLAVFAFARVTVRPFFAGQGFRSAALPIADVLEAVLVVVIGAFAIQGSQPRLASQ